MADAPEKPISVVEGGDRRPVPDPTLLTTQQLYREVAALRELFETRLNGYDKAIVVLQDIASSQPTPGIVMAAVQALEKQTSFETRALKELHESQFGEKFSSIETQFRERDTRAEQTAKDNKTSIDAALQAAKEAVSEQNKSNTLAIDKSEAAFTKQIDQIGTLIATTVSAIDGKINDMKERITTIESHGTGALDQRTENRNAFGYVVGGIGFVVALFSIIGSILFIVSKLPG
jgi:hypothetical protein